MNFKTFRHVLAFTLLLTFFTGCSKEEQPKPAQRTASEVISGMRFKQLVKTLELTEEQQAQVKTLLDAEQKEVAKINDDSTSSPTEHADRVSQVQKETYGKIKPLLSPAQLEKLEKMLTKTPKRKKTS